MEDMDCEEMVVGLWPEDFDGNAGTNVIEARSDLRNLRSAHERIV